jgi:translation initiation factor IF-2
LQPTEKYQKKKIMVEKEKNRAPVVVVMGHVDHGKSSILEAIKDLKITGKESGGITQHIGAYEIDHNSKKITFLDTPGHEAFSSMRSRGARVADIAVLVVAADDGVKAQTKEAILHIKKAELPMIVAINKIDKAEADPNRVAQELAESEVYLESIGGKVPVVLVSAKTKENIGELLEMILLIAEIEDLKADSSLPATGVIVESQLDPLKGSTATVIIEQGTLKRGDVISSSTTLGKVKNLEDFQGEPIDEVGPSMPAIVYGFVDVPLISDEFKVFSDIKSANNYVKEKSAEKESEKRSVTIGEESINIVLKADFLGSLEAIESMMSEIPQERISLNILKSDVGEISEVDVNLAKSSNATIFGFRVKKSPQVEIIAERDQVKILTFDIIYELIEKVREVMEKSITPKIERIDLGEAKVLALFFHGKDHQIIGCKVVQGEIKRGAEIEIYRDEAESGEKKLIGKGKIKGIKRGAREVESEKSGEECGIFYMGDAKIEEGDIIHAYVMKKEEIEGI